MRYFNDLKLGFRYRRRNNNLNTANRKTNYVFLYLINIFCIAGLIESNISQRHQHFSTPSFSLCV